MSDPKNIFLPGADEKDRKRWVRSDHANQPIPEFPKLPQRRYNLSIPVTTVWTESGEWVVAGRMAGAKVGSILEIERPLGSPIRLFRATRVEDGQPGQGQKIYGVWQPMTELEQCLARAEASFRSIIGGNLSHLFFGVGDPVHSFPWMRRLVIADPPTEREQKLMADAKIRPLEKSIRLLLDLHQVKDDPAKTVDADEIRDAADWPWRELTGDQKTMVRFLSSELGKERAARRIKHKGQIR